MENKEIRVYVVDCSFEGQTCENLDKMCACSTIIDEELFMDEAERQGNVYSLIQFQNEINDDISGFLSNSYVLFKLVDSYDGYDLFGNPPREEK